MSNLRKTYDDAPPPSPRGGSAFECELVSCMPSLRAFSRSLCGRQGIADDMAQNALAKALRARDSFQAGTNMKAWLFTILRNEFYSHARRAWRETHWDAAQSEAIASAPDEQEWSLELSDTARALNALPDTQREALILVAAGGISYDDAAKICGVAIGTVKSRVCRARLALTALLTDGDGLPDRQPKGSRDASDDILRQLHRLLPAAAQTVSLAI